jgi:hypothetical protein
VQYRFVLTNSMGQVADKTEVPSQEPQEDAKTLPKEAEVGSSTEPAATGPQGVDEQGHEANKLRQQNLVAPRMTSDDTVSTTISADEERTLPKAASPKLHLSELLNTDASGSKAEAQAESAEGPVSSKWDVNAPSFQPGASTSWDPSANTPLFAPEAMHNWDAGIDATAFLPVPAWSANAAAVGYPAFFDVNFANSNIPIVPCPTAPPVCISLQDALTVAEPARKGEKKLKPGSTDSPRTAILRMCGASAALANSGTPPHPPPPPPPLTPPSRRWKGKKQQPLATPSPVTPAPKPAEPEQATNTKLASLLPALPQATMSQTVTGATMPPHTGYSHLPKWLQPASPQLMSQPTLDQYYWAATQPQQPLYGAY